jgi:hypothetical protein
MDISDSEKLKNDMMRSGKFCLNDNTELEKVSEENRFVCHFCGGVFELDNTGNVVNGWFGGH